MLINQKSIKISKNYLQVYHFNCNYSGDQDLQITDPNNLPTAVLSTTTKRMLNAHLMKALIFRLITSKVSKPLYLKHIRCFLVFRGLYRYQFKDD